MPSLFERSPLWTMWLLLLALWLAFVAASITACGAGFIHPELYGFLPHYLNGDHPFWQTIFDDRYTEWGDYQARELSFILDYADSHFIAWSVQHGHPHFFSLAHYILLLVSGAALWPIVTRHLQLPRWLALTLVLLLWSTPTAFFYTSAYRSAKVAVLALSLLTVWAWLAARRPSSEIPGSPRVAPALGMTVAALAMPLFDKQGLAFLVIFVAFLAATAWRERQRQNVILLALAGTALALALLYSHVIGPELTQHFAHIRARTEYAQLPLGDLLHRPALAAKVTVGGALFTLDSFRFCLGNLPGGLGLLMGWLIFRALPAGPESGAKRYLAPRWLFVAFALLVWGTYSAMLLRNDNFLSNEWRRFLYTFPVQGLWLVIAAAALATQLRAGAPRWPWCLIAAALLFSNAYALQEHRFVLHHGKNAPFCENAARLRAELRPGFRFTSNLTREGAAALLKATPYRMEYIPPSAAEDRIFLALRAYLPEENP